MKYGCLGDEVNLASRLEALNKRYSSYLMIDDNTHGHLMRRHPSLFSLRHLDRVVVKGRASATDVYEVLSAQSTASDTVGKLVEEHAVAMEHYFARRFEEAKSHFARVTELEEMVRADDGLDVGSPFSPGAPGLFSSRIEGHLATPPPIDWDGADVLDSKEF